MSPHIAIDKDLEELESETCPPLYEVMILRNITQYMESERITVEEFHHYCDRLERAVARRSRRAS